MRRDTRLRATSFDAIDAATAIAERAELAGDDLLYLAGAAVVALGWLAVSMRDIAVSLAASEPRGRE